MKYLLIITILILGGFQNIASAQNIEEFMNDANDARDQMDFDKAAALYSEIIKLDSNNIEALYNRGFCENFWNKSEGLDDLHKVIKLDSLHEGAFQVLAESYSILGNFDLAEEYKLKAIALNPKSAENLLTQTRMANGSEEYAKAIEFCNEGIKLNDDAQNWLLLLERAEAHYLIGNYENAISDFEKCFNEYQAGLYSCNEYEMCGDAYKAMGNINKACEYWSIAVRNDDPEFDPASNQVKLKAKVNCNK
jgi:tetratricopeptide (TPR) repeat protein